METKSTLLQVIVRIPAALGLLLLLSTNGLCQQLVQLEDWQDQPQIGILDLSKDGTKILYTVSQVDMERNTSIDLLMLMDLETRKKHRLTLGVSDAQFSPDGKQISFKAQFSDRYGLFRAELVEDKEKISLGTPFMIAPLHTSNHFTGHNTLKNYAWSPDGKYIAYVSADPGSCSNRPDNNAPRIITRTLYKSRTGFSDNCNIRIYLAESDGSTTKPISSPGYDSHSLSWAPDSKAIAFLSNRTQNPDANYNNDIWTYELATGSETQRTKSIGTEHEPCWSPKGDAIAYRATKRPVNTKDSPPESTFLYQLDLASGEETKLTGSFDRGVDRFQWHPDGDWLYMQVRNEGKRALYRVKKGEEPEPVIEEKGMINDFEVGPEKILYTFEKPDEPNDLYQCNPKGWQKIKHTFDAYNWAKKFELAETEAFWFTSFDGTRVQGFITRPAGLTNGDKVPVIHRIHGGPHGMYGYSFDLFNQLLATQGYAVVFINPRGSRGYGQTFADGTLKAWGDGDYQDLMTGMDTALAHYPFLDGERMGVTGGSYGGFMTNWVVTQTDRYKAAVTVASVSNLVSFYGNSLYQLLIETEFDNKPWEDTDLLMQHSPITFAENVKTPTLLLHGENDMDVPIQQAEEFYIALRKLGVPTRFIRYPNEGHGIRQPQHREHYFREVLDWFENYL